MGMWVIVNWWVWSVPDFHFRKLEVMTLVRAELWPATPTSPKFAFSFALLDWAESLLLEAQVSLKDFCNWASEASPTLGCSIEISRDICCRYVGMSEYVCRMSN